MGLVIMNLKKRIIEADKMNRDEIVSLLKKEVCTVEFKKLNGDKRVMSCTLKESFLPAAKKHDPMSQKKVREINPEVVSVWDTSAEGWRSFRVANVIEIYAGEKA
jgi:hypothetical protein